MSKWVVDIHGDIEGDYEIIEEYKEPKTGHWISKGKGDGFKNWNCSKCGMLVRNSQRPWYKHCPNCGCRMESEETDDIEAMLEHLWNATVEDMRNEKLSQR